MLLTVIKNSPSDVIKRRLELANSIFQYSILGFIGLWLVLVGASIQPPFARTLIFSLVAMCVALYIWKVLIKMKLTHLEEVHGHQKEYIIEDKGIGYTKITTSFDGYNGIKVSVLNQGVNALSGIGDPFCDETYY